jgi:hypothetical protein
MGMIAGLVLGWIAASIAEGMVVGKRMARAKREEWEPPLTTSGLGGLFSRD